jgi:hypothetical protein
VVPRASSALNTRPASPSDGRAPSPLTHPTSETSLSSPSNSGSLICFQSCSRKMTPPLSLSLFFLLTPFLSFSDFLFLYSFPHVPAFPVHPAIPPPPPPWVEQTQTQLEHARIGELEQSLLLEKAQAERLLRELADNRVNRACHCHPPGQRLGP